MPHAAEVSDIQAEFQAVIKPYMQPSNLLANNLYDRLKLHWRAEPTQTAFPERDCVEMVFKQIKGVIGETVFLGAGSLGGG